VRAKHRGSALRCRQPPASTAFCRAPGTICGCRTGSKGAILTLRLAEIWRKSGEGRAFQPGVMLCWTPRGRRRPPNVDASSNCDLRRCDFASALSTLTAEEGKDNGPGATQ
jgi:hypothetical protein